MRRHRARPSTRRRLTASIAAIGLLVAACGDGDDAAADVAATDGVAADDTSTDDTSTDDATADVDGGDAVEDTAGPGSTPEDDTVEVVLRDFAFAGLPPSIAAGTRLTVVNEAERELHELVAFRLPDDEERSVEELAGLSPPELMAALGEPSTVLLAEPGGPSIPAVGDGTLAEPGRYALMCFIPTGIEPAVYLEAAAESDDGPPDVGGGPPHIAQGMYAELTVE